MAQVLGNLVTAGLTRIVPVTAGYSCEPGAETRTPSNTCSKYAVRKGLGTFRTTTNESPRPEWARQCVNTALLGKLVWNLIHETDKLWVRIMLAKYVGNIPLFDYQCPPQ
ncbi:hypothetical protein PIB30_049114, partial [Stylosanthes scabra]|nr:hypothetical protein [Stylosanthes scabra]